MSRLIIVQGLPGSGKSTIAKELVEGNPDLYLQVERDEIRKELSINRSVFNTDLEKEVTKIRDERIIEGLKAGRVVISSDTNLNTRTINRLLDLARQCKVPVDYIDLTHIPLQECINRDSKRPNPVGKEVIINFHNRYIRDDDPIFSFGTNSDLTLDNILVIPDVHSQHHKLIELLSKVGIKRIDNGWINESGYYVVFLGDIHDSRLGDPIKNLPPYSSALECIRIAMDLDKLGWATVLRSNHGRKLYRYLKGDDSKSVGLSYTLTELDILSNRIKTYIATWLDSLPYFYKFRIGDTEYVCTHAKYTEGMKQYNPSGKAVSDAIYGPTIKGVKYIPGVQDNREQWWLDPSNRINNTIQICGHYHLVYINDWVKIIDAECGSDNGVLMGYLPIEDRFITV